jgi:branched-chain amino acid transport system substrate-binding protein
MRTELIRRGARLAGLALLLALVGTQVVPAQPKGEPIKIGLLTTLTGSAARWGGYAQNGAGLAVDELNAAGGVLGRPLQIVLADSQCQPGQGVSALRKLISDHTVGFVIGDICSSVTLAAMPVVAESKVILLNAGSSHPDITYKAGVGGNVWTFRNYPTDELRTQIVTEYVAKQGAKRFSILNVDNDFGRGAAALSRKHIERLGGSVLSEDYFKAGESDFAPVLTKIKNLKPDVLLVYALPDAVPPLTTQIKAQAIKVRLAGVAEFTTPDIIKRSQADVLEGAVEGMSWAPVLGGEANRRFVEAYQKRTGDPPQVHAFTHYESVKLLARAIADAGSTEPARVRDALTKVQYDGMMGRVRFDDHNQAEVPMAILAVENGAPVSRGTFTTRINYPR